MLTTTTGDSTGRRDALDPSQSYIVEAPAGSGKTELLTQRYLRLLGLVDEPEQVIAITFTRKAAAEMRLRVSETLRIAAVSGSVEPHRRTALEFARIVLERSQAHGWSLIELGERLQIQTIDSLNARLAHQLPLLTSGLAGVDVTDNAESLYDLAARRTTEAVGESGALGDALRQLLAIADNSLTRLEQWLAGILQQRDRWLRLLQAESPTDLPAVIRERLRLLITGHLALLQQLAGDDNTTRLLLAAAQLQESGARNDDLSLWRSAAGILLTATGDWRKSFTRREGVPRDAKALKQELGALQDQFRATPGMRAALASLRDLPADGLGSEQQQALRALAPVVLRLLAELKLVFSAQATVDHTELALGALEALGAVDAPSDLLLALDRRIEHILVDEFQDTSHLQWEILARLTAGWESGDGRSLFLVGDPMQSIYRFRDADLSLFSRARDQGIGEIRLRALRLRTNYRSAPAIVDRINAAFEQLFAEPEASLAGGPSFTAAEPGRPAEPDTGIRTHWLQAAGQAEENRRVVEIAHRELGEHPDQSIGILVRSRSHLLGLREALAAAGLTAHAVEIDSLADTALGQDLLAFTSALLHPADRLAWLGVLHGPNCGIGWQDLVALCGDDREHTIPQLLTDDQRLQQLSGEGGRRARWLRQRLELAGSLRANRSPGQWLRACWQLIGGHGSGAGEPDNRQCEAYFSQLDRLARHGDLDDPASLQNCFSRPDGTETPRASGIELMTIHRAKGLEFDTVILPGLSRQPRGNSRSLLFIRDISLPTGRHLNLAAVHTSAPDPLLKYLQSHDREQEAAERTRLLYVAMTRARQRLHLVAGVNPVATRPRPGSLLAALEPALGALPESENGTQPATGPTLPEFVELPLRRRRHLPETLPRGLSVSAEPRQALPRPEFEWVNPASIQVGTVIHRELHRLAQAAATRGEPVAPDIDQARYRRELALLGVDSPDLGEAARRVGDALLQVWADPTGRWILAPHAASWSEQRITVRHGSLLEHLVIDRSFVDEQGQRWIIDYKTGRHLGAEVDAFVAAEVERYRQQLHRYAQAVAAFDRRPIRVGLYFPFLSRLEDWIPADPARNQSEPV